MRKLIIFIFSISIFICNTGPIITYANTNFARAENSTNLYKLTTNTSDLTDILCIIEKTYFVEILSDNGNTYKVNYNGEFGFIKKNDVRLVSNTPNTPFPENIKIVVGNTCNLRSTPTTKSSTNNIIATIQSGETNLQFIGRIFADEAIDFGGTTWYYVKYGELKGYIYNKYLKSITPIYENQEPSMYYNKIEYTTNPISHTPSLLIIALLLLPTLVILLILYLPRKNHK